VTATCTPLLSPAGFPYPRTTPSVAALARQGRLLRMTNNDKSAATWSDVKDKLGDFDRAGLLGFVQDLYTSEFSARPFRLGSDVLEPYKTIIGRWLRPDLHRASGIFRRQGEKAHCGLQESCRPIRFSKEVGLDDGAYHDALAERSQRPAIAGGGVAGDEAAYA
jgi:hypothetical protein